MPILRGISLGRPTFLSSQTTNGGRYDVVDGVLEPGKLSPLGLEGRFYANHVLSGRLTVTMTSRNTPAPPDPVVGMRLDIWLDVACLFRTRSDAQKACRNGKVQVNGQPAKSNRLVRPDDALSIGRPFGRRQLLRIRSLADRHVSRAQARELYEDLTPPPTAEEVERRRFERIYRAAVTPPTAPSRNTRRLLRKMKENEE